MNTAYSKKVLQLFKHPKNMGSIKNPDAHAQNGNPICGDLMRIYLKIKNKKITDISFETMGCVAAIATSSILTEIAKGKTLAQVKKISYNDLVKALGGLPTIKMHCADLAILTLRQAVQNYEKRTQK